MLRIGRLALFCCGVLPFLAAKSPTVRDFQFDRDTFAFTNSTVFAYREGKKIEKREDKNGGKAYNRRCFVMSRGVMQFHKFARFDPRGKRLDDAELAARVRAVAKLRPWLPALPEKERIVFPGYRNLRELSKARAQVLQENLGLGWPTYARVGNFRMFFKRDDDKYQQLQAQEIESTLASGDFFVAYLSDYPHFRINHAVLIYAQKPVNSANEIRHYLAYDPNHADAPRVLRWSPSMKIFNYPKDEEFVGGYTRVYRVYGKAWQ